MANAYIGISGWNYDSWKHDFFDGVPKNRWLEYCGERLTGLEINATFYRQQERTTFRKWRDAVPEDFRFAVKGHRYLTHNKKLADPEEPLMRERDRASMLGPKLGAVLWQLPDWSACNLDRLENFARVAQSAWPVRHAVEFRHPSWFDDEVASCLSKHGIGACMSDAADWPMWDVVTADFVYVRLHGHTRTYASRYSTQNLEHWAIRIAGWLSAGCDVHVYFDNDAEGHAPWDALRLLRMVRGS